MCLSAAAVVGACCQTLIGTVDSITQSMLITHRQVQRAREKERPGTCTNDHKFLPSVFASVRICDNKKKLWFGNQRRQKLSDILNFRLFFGSKDEIYSVIDFETLKLFPGCSCGRKLKVEKFVGIEVAKWLVLILVEWFLHVNLLQSLDKWDS